MVRNRATTPLKRTKIRMSMSAFNLYNLSRLTLPNDRMRTFYQQKWTAKSLLRQYHGEQVREGQWTRMFSRRLRAIVPMDPAYLAKNDGSAESAGRGSGLQTEESRSKGKRNTRSKEVKATPYMNMTFAPLERRLDVAIFRALFASSARQSRQMVVHGQVKVNGQVMRFPGYLLNPGDMFQVEPEKVLIAMGRRKQGNTQAERKELKEFLRMKALEARIANRTPAMRERCSNCHQRGHTVASCPKPLKCRRCREEGHMAVDCQKDLETPEDPSETANNELQKVRTEKDATKRRLAKLQEQAKSILASPNEGLGARQKRSLREFQHTIRSMMSRVGKGSILTDSLEAQFAELTNRLKIEQKAKEQGKSLGPSQQAGAETSITEQSKPIKPTTDVNYLTEEQQNELYNALKQTRDNPRDPSKPYDTPWQPRMYMSAFAFIPRYLEVNQNICAAVYLRHPVAKPGLAEVPTPYPETVNGSAFAWYLRRR